MVLGGLLVVALPPVDGAEVGQRVGFVDLVADLAGEGEGLLVVLGGLLVSVLLPVDDAEVG